MSSKEPGQAAEVRPLLSLSVDVEDWYQGIELPVSRWDEFEPRLEIGLRRVLKLLERTGGLGTFFILGSVAERHPDLVAEIAAAGHEVGSHGWSHTKVYELTPASFDEEVARADRVVASITGSKPTGFRAPYFSITRDSLWALDILRDRGYVYDASIYPGANYRYGIPGSSPEIHHLPNGLVEFPVSTFPVRGRRVGIGGAYLRILPLAVTGRALAKRLRAGQPSTIYMHPWEFDPKHPFVRFPYKAMATHYVGLRSTHRKVARILERHPILPMRDLLTDGGWLPRPPA